MTDTVKTNLYIIKFKKNGYLKTYHITATSELNAAVRLGQIYGDNRPHRNDVTIEIVDIKKAY